MKKSLLRILCCITAVLTLMGCFSAITLAAAAPTLWASPVAEAAESERPISAVKWWYDSEDLIYYLFMPSDGDLNNMQVWFTGAESCTIDSTAVANGGVTALSLGDHTVTFDQVSYPLCVMKSANIGTMYITTASGNMNYIHTSKGNKETGNMKMVNAKGKVIYDNTLSEIKGRGNATWIRPKKPYQIKLDKKTDLTGTAGKNKTWILLANYLERTMFRNYVTYNLAYDSGLTTSSLSTYVDLYCNGQYMGTYQLTEKVHINDDRIDINNLEDTTQDVNDKDLDTYPTFGDETANGATPGTSKGYVIPNNPEDITGGYLLELDYAERYATEASGFVTSRGQAVVIKEPEYASREQVAYISNFFQEFEDAVFASDGKNPTTGKYYYDYFDISSLARKYIIEEFTKNIDADVTSQYYYKPSDAESTVGYCGPVWDYDNALGNYKNGASDTPDGMYANSKKKYIYNHLYTQESFLNAVRSEWETTFVPLLEMCVGITEPTEGTTLRPIDEYYEMLAPSAAMNFTYWTNLDTEDNSSYNDTGSTYREHCMWLKDFMTSRLNYLNSVWSTADIEEDNIVSSSGSIGVPSILDFDGKHDTYIIDSEEALQKAADLLTENYNFEGVTLLQTADIHLTKNFVTGGYYNTDNANPDVSKLSNAFRGTYDGQGYKIYNLNMNYPDRNCVSIFGAAYKATFKDMHIASGNISGMNRAAGITGFGDTCTFLRCSNNATITTSTGKDGAGGLAGVARSGATFISCYNTGHITGYYPGGLTGWGQSNINISNCYNIGTITCTGTESAPLSRTGSARDFSTCYYLKTASVADKNGATALTAAQITDGTLLNGLNATSAVWEAGTNHPVLKTPERTALVKVATNLLVGTEIAATTEHYVAANSTIPVNSTGISFPYTAKVNGVETNQEMLVVAQETVIDLCLDLNAKKLEAFDGTGNYYIANAAQLQAFLDLTKTHDFKDCTVYILADIDAAEITTGGSFAGILNGKFARLLHLSAPLFEEVTGDVRKITVSDATLTGGGVIANTNSGRISYVTTQNMVIRGENAGGIVATNTGWINGCSTQGYVIAAAAGGIAATNSGTLQNCINDARLVASGGKAGGIAATNTGTLQNCVNTGMVNAGQKFAITDGAALNSYHWDWCAGKGTDVTALTDAALADDAFVQNLPALYWTKGDKMPTPVAVLYELGDSTGDDCVSIADAVMQMRYISDVVSAEDLDLVASDVDGIQGFGMTDIIRTLQYISGSYIF